MPIASTSAFVCRNQEGMEGGCTSEGSNSMNSAVKGFLLFAHSSRASLTPDAEASVVEIGMMVKVKLTY